MRTALQITSWISVVIGVLAIIGSVGSGADAASGILGGALFLGQGIVALIYVNQTKEQ